MTKVLEDRQGILDVVIGGRQRIVDSSGQDFDVMLRVHLDRLYKLKVLASLLLPLVIGQYGLTLGPVRMEAYHCKIIQVNSDFVESTVCESLENLLVFVLRRFIAVSFLTTALALLVVLVHEVVLVAEVIFVDGDVAQCRRDGLLRGGLEAFQKGLARILVIN